MRRAVGLAVAMAMAALMSGCGSGGTGAAASTKGCEGAVIGDSIPQGSDPGLTLIHRGFESEAQARGAKVESADANLDVNKQLSDIDGFVQRGAQAVSVWPMDGTAVRPAMQRAEGRGLVVVTQQTPQTLDSATNVQFDDEAIGASLATYLAQKLGPGAKVAAITGPQQVELFRNLASGFARGAKAAGLDVVATQENAQLSPQKAAEITGQFKTKYGADLVGIFDTLNVTALATATVRGDGFEPVIVSYQGNTETQKAVEDGRLAAIAYVPNTIIGRAKAWAVCQKLAGKDLPSTITVPYLIADRANVAAIPTEDAQLKADLDFGLDGDRVVYQGLELPKSAVPQTSGQ